MISSDFDDANKTHKIYSGGPLSIATGDGLAAMGVRLYSAYGGTEFGAVTSPISETLQSADPDPDWAWMKFPLHAIKWEFVKYGVYELVVQVCAILISTISLFISSVPKGILLSSPNGVQHPRRESICDWGSF